MRILSFFSPLSLVGLVGCLVGATEALGAEAEPPQERILELNAGQFFGGEISAKDGRVTVRFPGNGLFGKGFRCAGAPGRGFISDPKDVKAADVRTLLLEGAEGGFSVVGLDSGSAVSRFEMEGDFKISFKLRLPPLLSNASFSVRVNQKDSRNFIVSSFFQDLVVVDGGKTRKKAIATGRYAGHPVRWFPPKSPGVPFEILFKDKKLSILTVGGPAEMGKEKRKEWGKAKEKEKEAKSDWVEIVSQDGIESPTAGKIAFEFRNLSLLMSDLVIEGKYSRAWADAEIAKLKKEGKLKLKEAEPAAPKEAAKPGGKEGGPAEDAKASPPKPKKGKTNIDEPDPEAGQEL